MLPGRHPPPRFGGMNTPPRSKRPMRRHGEVKALVEALLSRSPVPLSAYDISHRSSGEGRALYPPQVYRALTELIGEGKVRRIEVLNAFCLSESGNAAVGICDVCGEALQIEISHPDSALRRMFEAQGFEPISMVVECVGRCRRCRATGAPGHIDC
jgi:Fe2+ or Zn2+ uptake regulation protein